MMMRTTRLSVAILATFLFSFLFVFADYVELSNKNNYILGDGIWSESIILPTFDASALSVGRYAPVVKDISGDGIADIFVISDRDLEVYNYNTVTGDLDFIDSVVVAPSVYEPNISAPVISDLDLDGDDNVLVYHSNRVIGGAGKQGNLSVYSFNGSDIILDYQVVNAGIGSPEAIPSWTEIQCDSRGAPCLIQFTGDYAGGGIWYADVYNRSMATKRGGFSLNHESILGADEDFSYTLCPNPMDSLTSVNLLGGYDTLPDNEEIVGLYFIGDQDDTIDQGVYIRIFTLNATGTGYDVYSSERMDIFDYKNFDATHVCHQADDERDNFGYWVSNPIFADFDEKPSNGLEMAFGLKEEPFEMKLYLYRNIMSGADIFDYFPTGVDTFDTNVMGNAFVGNVFTESGFKDICIFNYATQQSQVQLACGSKDWGSIFNLDESMTASLDVSTRENVSYGNQFYNIPFLTHAVNYDDDIETGFSTGSADTSEYLTPYGVMSVDYDSCENEQWLRPTECDLVIDYELPSGHLAVVASDFDGIGYDDIVGMSSDSLWYFDDGFSNTNCDAQDCINQITISPCNGSVWLWNTSVSMTVKVIDVNDDDLSVRAVLYEGESFAIDSGWSANYSSGTSIPISFDSANHTIVSGNLQVQARDTDDTSKVDSVNIPITVSATSGIVEGQCTSTISFITPTEEAQEEATETESADENVVDTGVGAISSYTGLSGQLVMILVMVIIAVTFLIYGAKGRHEPTKVVGLIALAEILLTIVGWKLGYFDVQILILLLVAGAISAVLLLSKTARANA